MTISRSALRLLAGELLDTVYNGAMHPRYENTDWLNRELGLIHMEEWKGLLTVAPTYQTADRDITLDASGLIALSGLDSGAGNAKQNTFRVLEVAVDGQPYRYVEMKDYPFAASEGNSEWIWLIRGRYLQVPNRMNSSATAQVNYWPCRADLLADDGDTVDFPDGYELVLARMLAARMGGKGAEEAGAAQYLKAEADETRKLMRIDLRRVAARNTPIQHTDDVADWGQGS